MSGGIIINAVAASVAGAMLSLDRTAAFQVMVSRPIVAAPVIGYVTGCPDAGLIIGITLELLFMGDFPVGSYVPVHETGLAVLVTAVTAAALGSMGQAARPAPYGARANELLRIVSVVPASLMVSLPVAKVYQMTDSFTRRFNAVFFHSAASALAMKGTGRGAGGANLVKKNLSGLAVFFLAMLAALLVTVVPMALIAAAVFSRAGAPWFLWPAFSGLVILGLSAAFNTVDTARGVWIFALCGAASAIVWGALR